MAVGYLVARLQHGVSADNNGLEFTGVTEYSGYTVASVELPIPAEQSKSGNAARGIPPASDAGKAKIGFAHLAIIGTRNELNQAGAVSLGRFPHYHSEGQPGHPPSQTGQTEGINVDCVIQI